MCIYNIPLKLRTDRLIFVAQLSQCISSFNTTAMTPSSFLTTSAFFSPAPLFAASFWRNKKSECYETANWFWIWKISNRNDHVTDLAHLLLMGLDWRLALLVWVGFGMNWFEWWERRGWRLGYIERGRDEWERERKVVCLLRLDESDDVFFSIFLDLLSSTNFFVLITLCTLLFLPESHIASINFNCIRKNLAKIFLRFFICFGF